MMRPELTEGEGNKNRGGFAWEVKTFGFGDEEVFVQAKINIRVFRATNVSDVAGAKCVRSLVADIAGVEPLDVGSLSWGRNLLVHDCNRPITVGQFGECL